MTGERKHTALLEAAGQGSLYLSGCGQHTTPLNRDPVAAANRPPLTGWCDTSYIVRYDGTDLCQWYGRKADGKFHPHGKIMRLTKAGRAALNRAKATGGER